MARSDTDVMQDADWSRASTTSTCDPFVDDSILEIKRLKRLDNLEVGLFSFRFGVIFYPTGNGCDERPEVSWRVLLIGQATPRTTTLQTVTKIATQTSNLHTSRSSNSCSSSSEVNPKKRSVWRHLNHNQPQCYVLQMIINNIKVTVAISSLFCVGFVWGLPGSRTDAFAQKQDTWAGVATHAWVARSCREGGRSNTPRWSGR